MNSYTRRRHAASYPFAIAYSVPSRSNTYARVGRSVGRSGFAGRASNLAPSIDATIRTSARRSRGDADAVDDGGDDARRARHSSTNHHGARFDAARAREGDATTRARSTRATRARGARARRERRDRARAVSR
jgi:hypothetical protein